MGMVWVGLGDWAWVRRGMASRSRLWRIVRVFIWMRIGEVGGGGNVEKSVGNYFRWGRGCGRVWG